ncbi:Protein fmp52, mitochondrial [Lachnellula occidentalis]|uniref:Protein fmp52, mitochondrial n=1 Tax=Lachnellula occidentalis TaxID=215460 RepID=A0A8H8S8D7_9HELO|nr:Protein fmp52, mitochondrial [Lachnellula occidentalis]
MTSTAVVGSTGLVVGFTNIPLILALRAPIYYQPLALPSITNVYSLSRRVPTTTDPKLHPLTDADNAQWSPKLTSISPPPSIFFSALGTTKAAAGSFENQRRIDYDLNLALATAAKSAGVKVYVLISGNSANPKSSFAYIKMKGELEEAVKELGFEHTVLTGEPAAEFVVRKIAGCMSLLGHWAVDFWAQDCNVIAKAAVSAGLKALEDGESVPKVWVLEQSEIVRLGRTEWKA